MVALGQPRLTEYRAGLETKKLEKCLALGANAMLCRSGPELVTAWAGAVLDDSDYSWRFKRGAFRRRVRPAEVGAGQSGAFRRVNVARA